jgi:hypothetical protein
MIIDSPRGRKEDDMRDVHTMMSEILYVLLFAAATVTAMLSWGVI